MLKNINHILISRTDNIGDVILTLPMASIIKQYYPHIKITFLVRDYTSDIITLNPDVDDVISWDNLSKMSRNDAVSFLRRQHIDCVIHAFPKSAIAMLMRKARIKYRIGTSHRLYHWFTCNKLVNFSRAKSNCHEAILNLKLLKPLGINTNTTVNALKEIPFLQNAAPLPSYLQSYFHPEKFNLIIHPFTNGNTREWPLTQFNQLIDQLPKDQFQIIITGSPKESQKIKEKFNTHFPDIIDLSGQCTLSELAQVIAHADGLIANSTGPLHLAAALGINTLGLFPLSPTANAMRWEPIGKHASYLSADPNCQSKTCKDLENDCVCMRSITCDQVMDVLSSWRK